VINCNGLCCFGIQLGPDPWYHSANIFGGNVTYNQVSGAGVLINAGGAGTYINPITVAYNAFSQPRASFTCAPLCRRLQPGAVLNFSPNSFVFTEKDKNVHTTRAYCM